MLKIWSSGGFQQVSLQLKWLSQKTSPYIGVFTRQRRWLSVPPLHHYTLWKEYSHVTFSRDLTGAPSAPPEDTQSHTQSLSLCLTHAQTHTPTSLPFTITTVLSSLHPRSQQLTHREGLSVLSRLLFLLFIANSQIWRDTGSLNFRVLFFSCFITLPSS